MILLRLLANTLLYLALGLLVYWVLLVDIIALWMAIGFTIISGLLLIYTADVKRATRRANNESYNLWDFWYLTELLETPFRLLIWLLKGLWRIFD